MLVVCGFSLRSLFQRYFNATSTVFQRYFDAFGALKYRLCIEKQTEIKRTHIGLISDLQRTYSEPSVGDGGGKKYVVYICPSGRKGMWQIVVWMQLAGCWGRNTIFFCGVCDYIGKNMYICSV